MFNEKLPPIQNVDLADDNWQKLRRMNEQTINQPKTVDFLLLTD